MPKPPSRRIDLTLVAGAMVFGLGGSLAGICPARQDAPILGRKLRIVSADRPIPSLI